MVADTILLYATTFYIMQKLLSKTEVSFYSVHYIGMNFYNCNSAVNLLECDNVKFSLQSEISSNLEFFQEMAVDLD